MSGVDVRDLARDDLPEAAFPVSSQSNFRLLLAPSVHQGIQQHAKGDCSIEICGVLVGLWKRDEQGPYADAQHFIQCDSASSKFAEVTFTHESWAQINNEMDSKYDDFRILGWYHSHPDFGIFLSDRDCFIQENFFSGAGQVAYVVDPVRDLEGVFSWQAGKPTLLPHYWVGEEIYTSHASESSVTTERTKYGAKGGSLADERQLISSQQQAPLGMSPAILMMAWLAIFLLGYFCAGWRTTWEREKIAEGAVIHYGLNKVMKFGLGQSLAGIQERLRVVSAEVNKLPTSTTDLTPEEMKDLAKQRDLIAKNLDYLDSALGSVSQEFSFSREEEAVLSELAMNKVAELRQLAQQLALEKNQATKKAVKQSEKTKTKMGGSKPTAVKNKSTGKAEPAPKQDTSATPAKLLKTSVADQGDAVGAPALNPKLKSDVR